MRRKQRSREFLRELYAAEATIRASLSSDVKFLSREQINAIADQLQAPIRRQADYRRSHYAE